LISKHSEGKDFSIVYFWGICFLGDRLWNGSPMVSDRCPVCQWRWYIVAKSLDESRWNLAHRWFKMLLGTEVGLGSGHIVLDGDPAPPQFSDDVFCGQTVAHLSYCWALVCVCYV